jgi:putative nucleotidyltransferase with HDIG domain
MSDPLAGLDGIAEHAWLVGGALRDRLLGRPTDDYDVAVHGEPRRLARALARSAQGHAFALSETFGGWRVVAHDRTWQVDLLPLTGETIEDDLAHRDFTINAVAQPLSGGGYVDPFGGLEDLRRRRLRMVSPGTFAEDPLRTLRLARLAAELGFAPEPETARSAARSAGALREVAPERIFLELRRIVCSDRPLRGLEMMDALTVTEVILPELARLQGIEQSHFHHLDVYQHTRAVLAETIALVRDPGRAFGEYADAIDAVLREPLANEMTRGQALRFGALFHDVAKPRTRDVTPQGRITFIGHDATGADMASAALERLRASDRLREYVAGLTRHHLRLGFLVHEMPLSRRAIYGYLKACEPVQVEVTVLSVADRLATRGSGSEEAIAKHLELARQLVGEALAWRAAPPRAPVRGDQLARALGIDEGPELGRLLAELEEASFAGEISGREEALDRARRLLSAVPGSSGGGTAADQ